jgi:WD40 repeat protein
MLLDPETGQEIRSFESPNETTRLLFSRDGSLLAALFGKVGEVGRPGQVMIWETKTGKQLATLRGHSSAVHALAFSPDGSRLATRAGESRSHNGEVMLWDTSTGQVLLTLKEVPWGIGDIAFTLDGHHLLTAGNITQHGKFIQVWDATPIPSSP